MTSRGYSSYRGKRTGLKIFVAVILVVVLICALLFLRFQDYIVFDEKGAHFEFPQSENTQTDDPNQTTADDKANDNLVIDIQQPANTFDEIKAGAVDAAALTADNAAALSAQLTAAGENAFVTAMMSEDGVFSSNEGIKDALAAADTYSVARISAFRNDLFADSTPAAVIKNVDNKNWYDGNVLCWLNPYSDETVNYVRQIAVQCAELGFDEVLVDNGLFPTYGRTERLNFGDTTESKTEAINAFYTALDQALEEYDVRLSMVVSASDLLTGSNADAGFDLALLPECVERVYVDASAGDSAALREAYKAVRTDDNSDAAVVVMCSSLTESGSCLVG